MAIVFVKETRAVSFGGGMVTLRGGAAWDSDAELVKEYPHLFESEPSKVNGRIERATAAPGEKRAVRPPKKKTASE